MGGENPRAAFKAPITVEDVLNLRMIAYPFRLFAEAGITHSLPQARSRPSRSAPRHAKRVATRRLPPLPKDCRM
jgi:acetyl-CoA acetyltransferase